MAADELGPWRGARLRETAERFNGDGADDDLPEPHRFARGVGRLIVRRQQRNGASMRRDAVSLFLLMPEGVPGASAKREPTLGDGDVEVAGRIWFVGCNAQTGRYLEPASTEPGDLFDEVEAMGCGTAPAVLFNPRISPPSLHFYPNGVREDAISQSIEIGGAPVTVERVEAILDRMWEMCFISPDAQIEHGSGVWKDAAKHWTAEQAEAIVQSHMKTALAVALVDCVIRHEQPTPLGRVDLEIEQSTGTGWTRPVEMEVKVLRERGSTGRPKGDLFNNRWIRRGARQAAAYRDARQALAGMLCCFDMRVVDRDLSYCTDETAAYAAGLDVRVFRRFLYNSAEAARLARYGP